MLIFLMMYIIVLAVWVVNSFFALNKAEEVFVKSMGIDMWQTSVDDIHDYHSAFNFKNWFGFRHWFFPYKIEGEIK